MRCDYFDAVRCRSCSLMGVPRGVRLADKQRRVAQALNRVAPGVSWLPAYPGPESAFRNRAKLVVGGAPRTTTVGILDRTGRGVDLRQCGLYDPVSPRPHLALLRSRLPAGRGPIGLP